MNDVAATASTSTAPPSGLSPPVRRDRPQLKEPAVSAPPQQQQQQQQQQQKQDAGQDPRVKAGTDDDGPGDEDAESARADSEAETIIQSGREELSPQKRRNHVHHGGDKAGRPNLDPERRQRADDRHRGLNVQSPSRSRLHTSSKEHARPAHVRRSSYSPGRARETKAVKKYAASDDDRDNGDGPRYTSPSRDRPHEHRNSKPPPLLPTDRRRHVSEDRESVSSSGRSSPFVHSRAGRPYWADHASPAKMPVKKRRDRSGRTPLARACAAHEIEAAKECLTEQPGDLDVPDYAGNTPLQIASLGGCAEIVEFLINAGCDIDCKNGDKDTPLIDAVENGHLEVVKLLLHAGVNPRVGNAEGDEPYDLINLDHENHDAIRREIANAKKEGFRTRRSDDQRGRSSSIARDRPRADSAAGARDSTPPLPGHARRRTVRSEATRNDLLWTKPTFENLREFAAKGDMAGAATILNVLQKADTESLIAAAKGGHDEVLGLLLGMGNPDPDPEPHPALKPEYNTPMLAAIGRGNNTVIQLLLDQPDFNPTRRDARGRTYFEISESRRGDYWEQEYDMLKKAYEKFVQKRGRRPDGSPKMLKEREARLPNREPSPSRKAVKGHGPRRPPQEESSHERRRDEPGLTKRPKPTESKSRPQENSDAGLGRDRDTPNSNSGSAEEPPKRRRLFAGRPPPGHANRRESQLSSDSQSGREDAPRPPFGAKKDRGPSLKRSRHSQSPGPYQPSSHRKDGEALKAVKKRKTEVDEVSKPTVTPRVKSPELSAPEQKRRPSVVPPKNSSKSDRPSDETNKPSRPPDIKHESKKPQSVKDTPPTEPATKVEKKAAEPAPRRPMDETASKAMEAERKDREVQLNQDAEKAAADREKRRIEHETRVAEKEKQRMEQEAFAAAAEKEAAAREAMLKKEAEDMAAAEAERQRLERESRAAEAARQAEEAREASRLAKEREAAEEERRRKESEQKRARQAEEERQKRLEQERLRLMRMRREQEDQEQRRRDRLPARLKAAANYIGSNDPIARSRAWLEDFFPIVMATTRQIDQQCNDGVADEYWVPNYLVAPILGTNDLQLSQYATWEKRQATPTQRNNLWRVTGRALIRDGNMDVLSATIADVMQRHALTKPLFFAMEHVFWVKEIAPHLPHLHGLDIQYQKMYIDPEPGAGDQALTETAKPQTNGFVPNGITNT